MTDRLPWHDAQWSRLFSPGGRARLPHALLLRGQPGLGKRRFALRLARALLCRSPSPEDACGKCRSCHLVCAGAHPDLHRIEAPEDRKLIGIDRIRELIDRVALTASGGAGKVVVVTPAELMTRSAANTLLKTLEEPPGDAVFLLVSDRSSLLPATVRSRCQTLSFACPPAAVALSWLEGRIDGASPAPALLALAHGAPLRALDLAGRGALRKALQGDLTLLLEGAVDPVATAERWGEQGVDEISSWLTGIVQEAIRTRAAPELAGAPPELRELARKADLDDWFRVLDGCLAARGALARQINLNEKLALESLALACRRNA